MPEAEDDVRDTDAWKKSKLFVNFPKLAQTPGKLE